MFDARASLRAPGSLAAFAGGGLTCTDRFVSHDALVRVAHVGEALLAAPPILLLDESTSSLDGLNEQRLRLAIDAVAENRTLLVIAHRLSTVVDSDQIVVLQKGEVVGIGTHSELVESTPLYRDLAKHQLLV